MLSEVEEIKRKIEYCKSAIEPYGLYTNMIAQGINDLNELEGLVADLTEKNLEKALEIVSRLSNLGSPYASFLPDAAENFRAIQAWLEKLSKKQ